MGSLLFKDPDSIKEKIRGKTAENGRTGAEVSGTAWAAAETCRQEKNIPGALFADIIIPADKWRDIFDSQKTGQTISLFLTVKPAPAPSGSGSVCPFSQGGQKGTSGKVSDYTGSGRKPGSMWFEREDFSFGPFTVVFRKMQLLRNSQAIPLSLMEFKLLAYLVLHRGFPVNTKTLIGEVWEYSAHIAPGTVYTHVSWLPKNLKTDENPAGYIKTVRSVGYMFTA